MTTPICCRACQHPCVKSISNSQKNPGKLYWRCENKCTVFNGWVNEIGERVTTTPTTPKSGSSCSKNCKACNTRCIVSTSKSEKNSGRRFFACPNHCANAWNGWVDDGDGDTKNDILLFPKKNNKNNNSTSQQSRTKNNTVNSSMHHKMCVACNNVCLLHISATPENCGNKYFQCTSCSLFNGWVVAENNKMTSPKPPRAKKMKLNKNKNNYLSLGKSKKRRTMPSTATTTDNEPFYQHSSFAFSSSINNL